MRERVKSVQNMVARLAMSADPVVPLSALALLAEMAGLLADLVDRVEKLDAEALRYVATVDGLGPNIVPGVPAASRSDGEL